MMTTDSETKVTHKEEEQPLEGQYLPIADIFKGQVFSSWEGFSKWANMTKIKYDSVKSGYDQNTGIQGVWVRYE